MPLGHAVEIGRQAMRYRLGIRWNEGVTPSPTKSDTKIDHLIEAGKVTERGTTVLLNRPVISTPETTA